MSPNVSGMFELKLSVLYKYNIESIVDIEDLNADLADLG